MLELGYMTETSVHFYDTRNVTRYIGLLYNNLPKRNKIQ